MIFYKKINFNLKDKDMNLGFKNILKKMNKSLSYNN